MGTFLSCEIAKTIVVKKERYKKEEVLENLGKTIDLNIYMEPLENEDYLLLEMKIDYLEKYDVKFVEEQLKISLRNANQEQRYKNTISQLKGKEYDELMEIATFLKYSRFS